MTPEERFNQNMSSYERLYQIYREVKGSGRGPNDLGALRRSMIILMCGSWEAYFEDEVLFTLSVRLNGLTNPHQLPEGLRLSVYDAMHSKEGHFADLDARDLVWQLSGDGWKGHIYQWVDNKIKNFNTPKTKQIDDVFRKVFGGGKLSDNWNWAGQSAVSSKRKLNEFVSLRGDIAHARLDDEHIVSIGTVTNRATFLRGLVRNSVPIFQQLRNV